MPWGVQVERVVVILSYINSIHVDDSDGDDNTQRDDIIADHNGVEVMSYIENMSTVHDNDGDGILG